MTLELTAHSAQHTFHENISPLYRSPSVTVKKYKTQFLIIQHTKCQHEGILCDKPYHETGQVQKYFGTKFCTVQGQTK